MILPTRVKINRWIGWMFWITLFILIILSSVYIQTIDENKITNSDVRFKLGHLKRTSIGIMYLFAVAFIFLAGQQSKVI